MDEIVSFAELERFIDLPVRTYSSGMYMRLGFSIAAHIRADVLLLDEVFAVGDEEFQRKCFGKIHEFKSRGGTIVFVSHDAQAVERLCDRAVLLRQGSMVFDGETRDAIAQYRRLLADERSPDELAAGPARVGHRARRRSSRRGCSTRDGEPRAVQFASGEPLTVELVVAADAGVAPPSVSLELRDEHGGLALGGVVSPTAELGWGDGRRRAPPAIRDRPPAARRGPASTSAARSSRRRGRTACSHLHDDAAPLLRRPRRGPRPAPSCSRAAGACRRSAASAPIGQPMSSRTCPDWPR